MATAYVKVADRHPEAVGLLVDRPVESPNGLEFLGLIMAIFEKTTSDIRVAALAFMTVSSWVIGTVTQEHGPMGRLHAGHGPDVTSVAPEHMPIVRFREVCVNDLTAEERFSEGLEIVLDGVEKHYFSS